MREQILSAHIESDDKVVVMTKKGLYHHKMDLTKKQSEKLLSKIIKAQEINTEHWQIEWVYNGVPL